MGEEWRARGTSRRNETQRKKERGICDHIRAKKRNEKRCCGYQQVEVWQTGSEREWKGERQMAKPRASEKTTEIEEKRIGTTSPVSSSSILRKSSPKMAGRAKHVCDDARNNVARASLSLGLTTNEGPRDTQWWFSRARKPHRGEGKARQSRYLVADNCNPTPARRGSGLISVRSNEAWSAKNARNLPRSGNDKRKNVQNRDRSLLAATWGSGAHAYN